MDPTKVADLLVLFFASEFGKAWCIRISNVDILIIPTALDEATVLALDGLRFNLVLWLPLETTKIWRNHALA